VQVRDVSPVRERFRKSRKCVKLERIGAEKIHKSIDYHSRNAERGVSAGKNRENHRHGRHSLDYSYAKTSSGKTATPVIAVSDDKKTLNVPRAA